jgi:hypothetical protein
VGILEELVQNPNMRMETKDNEGYTVVHATMKRWEEVRFAEEKLKVLLRGKESGFGVGCGGNVGASFSGGELASTIGGY